MENSKSDSGKKDESLSDVAGLAMYRVAYDEGMRTIDDQVSELDSMRQRSLSFLSYTGAATAFLVGAGINQDTRTGSFRVLAACASLVSVVAILTTALVLFGFHFRVTKEQRARPDFGLGRRIAAWHQWQFRVNAQVLVNKWIDVDLGGDAEREFLRSLALFYDEEARENSRKLRSIRGFYYTSVLTGASAILLWAALVWIYR